MRWKAVGVAVLLAGVSLTAAQQDSPNLSREREITLRGCVMPAQNDTFILTDVTQSPGAGGVILPEIAHGRRVLFWMSARGGGPTRAVNDVTDADRT